MIESVREMAQPPVWWTTPNVKLTPSTINPVEFMQAHDTLQAYLDRVSLVRSLKKFVEKKKKQIEL